MMRTHLRTVGASTLVVACAYASPSLAQSETTENTAGNAQRDIIVTAQRRGESIQDVPASISAFGTEALRELNVQNIGDIARAVPNLAWQDNGLVARYNIRGITLNDTSEGNESPIGLYIDNTYFGFVGASKAALFDLDRVEVLRGPQGTLYGRNTTGGLTSFFSVEPTAQVDGYVSAQYGRFNQFILEGAVGGAIADKVRVRISGKSNRDDGFQTNVVDGSKWGRTRELSGRFQLAVDISPDTELLFNIHGTDTDSRNVGYGFFGIRNPTDGTECSVELSLTGACVNSGGFRDPDPDPTRIFSNSPPLAADIDSYGGFVRLTHDFGSVTLTSQTAYENVSKFLAEDADSSPISIAEDSTSLEGEQFTQELRLNGASGNVDWVAGLFYYEDERNIGFFIDPGSFRTNASKLKTSSIAAYADVQFKATEKLTISAGLRYTHDDKRHTGNFDDFFGFSGNLIPFEFDDKYDSVTGRLVLSYEASPDALFYASVSTGGKGPAFNTLLATADPDPNQAAASEPEEITAFEAGFKTELFDRKLRLNGAAFYYDYSGIQQTFTPPNERTPRLANIGSADVYGAELEASLRPVPEFELFSNISILRNEIDSVDPTFDGKQLATSPRFSARVGGSYIFDLGNAGSLKVGADYRYQSKVFFAPDNDPYETQEGYGVANALVSWTAENDRLVIEGFADNVFDQEYAVHAFTFRGFGFNTNVVWGRPVTYGIRTRYDF